MRRHILVPTPSGVLSVIAIIIALGGTATAATVVIKSSGDGPTAVKSGAGSKSQVQALAGGKDSAVGLLTGGAGGGSFRELVTVGLQPGKWLLSARTQLVSRHTNRVDVGIECGFIGDVPPGVQQDRIGYALSPAFGASQTGSGASSLVLAVHQTALSHNKGRREVDFACRRTDGEIIQPGSTGNPEALHTKVTAVRVPKLNQLFLP